MARGCLATGYMVFFLPHTVKRMSLAALAVDDAADALLELVHAVVGEVGLDQEDGLVLAQVMRGALLCHVFLSPRGVCPGSSARSGEAVSGRLPARPPGTGNRAPVALALLPKNERGSLSGRDPCRQVSVAPVVAVHRLGQPERHPAPGHVHRALEERLQQRPSPRRRSRGARGPPPAPWRWAPGACRCRSGAGRSRRSRAARPPTRARCGPPVPPPRLSWSRPKGRSSSSWTTRRSVGRHLVEARRGGHRLARGVHVRLGLEQEEPRLARASPCPKRPWNFDWPSAMPTAPASRSTTRKPRLCRCPRYSGPGFPSPTTSLAPCTCAYFFLSSFLPAPPASFAAAGAAVPLPSGALRIPRRRGRARCARRRCTRHRGGHRRHRSDLLLLRHGDHRDGEVHVALHPDALGQLHLVDVEGLGDLEMADVRLDLLRDGAGQRVHLEVTAALRQDAALGHAHRPCR